MQFNIQPTLMPHTRTEKEDGTEALPPESSTPGRSRHALLDLVLVLFLVSALAFIGYTEWQRRATAKALATTTQKLQELERNARASGDAIAKDVLARAGKHILLPGSPPPAVATIVNAEDLRKQNPENQLFRIAENGDHLIITETRAMLYDAKADRIKDVLPVVRATPTPSPAPTASPSPLP